MNSTHSARRTRARAPHAPARESAILPPPPAPPAGQDARAGSMGDSQPAQDPAAAYSGAGGFRTVHPSQVQAAGGASQAYAQSGPSFSAGGQDAHYAGSPYSPPVPSDAGAPKKSGGLPLKGIGLAMLLGALLMFALLALAGMGGRAASGASFGKGCIGLIEINGVISSSDNPDSLFSVGQPGSGSIAKLIEQAGARSDVRALLISIDSPGGSPLGSREIYRALRESEKPKVAYLRETAASGGYYVAAGADYIVSEPDTLTGSIGVRMSTVDLSGLFSKIGYNETTIKSGKLKDIGAYDRPMTEEERAVLEGIVNESFQEFKGVVQERRGRKLQHPAFEQVLDARVLTGRQAYAVGLVDEIGSRKDAIARASAMANETGLDVCPIQSERGGFFSRLLSGSLSGLVPAQAEGGWRLWY